ncbi:MAG: class I SAM-dependent methyltransferase, partial [Candidatus Omnitrophica bacterium]|nr:class I SAM-dependent methyltransferase [Candidatus Omnitrophota bacterium]
MSEVFGSYAKYYDLLYKNKDYAGEASYIHGLIQQHKPSARSILNLGCGTGKHDVCLERFGYQITGVDQSDMMLSEANKRVIPGKLDFLKGDVRTLDLGRKFDVVVSLFHVMSYQTTDEDIFAALTTAARHLVPGGILIFDFWNGEGVLKDPPEVRIKRLEDDAVKIVRIAEPVVHEDQHVVDVSYQIISFNKGSGQYSELYEKHAMRYFFLPELEA